MNRSVLFECHSCGAKYLLTRMEASTEPTKSVACISCDEPFTAREGDHFLKYFLIERPRKAHGASLHR